jgi:hypothetical protein
MAPFGLQKELVDDRRRNLVAPRLRWPWPVGLEDRGPAETQPRRWRASSLLVLAYSMTMRKSPDKPRSSTSPG